MAADTFPRAAVYPAADRLLPAQPPRRGQHRARRHRGRAATFLAALAALLAVAGACLLVLLTPGQAHASTAPSAVAALRWAETKAGHPYVWGGTGPGYDCSGLVYEAYLREGVNIGRDTFDMLVNRHLVRVPIASAPRGALLFYGTGHVELKTRRGSFGALRPGTLVGWHRPGGSWRPTMAFVVR
jgi:cell wall-associated NlpC family hydrolase